MKIAILTIPPRINFGGILQAFALQTALERLGHQVTIIDRPFQHKLPLGRMICAIVKRFILKYILRKNVHIFEERYYNTTYPTISQNTQKFISKYLHTKIYSNSDKIQPNEYDAIVVGSDQIWRRKYIRKIEDSFLAFTKGWGIKRISYAASFGTSDWEYSIAETKKCGELLKKFDKVSVREYEGVDLCRDRFGVEATQVLDPTLLLTADDYNSLIEDSVTVPNKGDLLCYVLDNTPQKQAIIKHISDKLNLTPFSINAEWSTTAEVQQRIQPSVEQWLRSFRDAIFVVTDSFHGTVFSIIFNKPFITIANSSRGMSRFSSLLGIFGLRSRLITNLDQFDDSVLNASYKNNSQMYDILKKESYNMLSI